MCRMLSPLEVVMKKSVRVLAGLLLAGSTMAHAAADAAPQDAGFLVYLFAGFFAVIVLTQLVPAGILLFGMLKGLFSSRESDSRSANSK